ncbi:MAG: ankyrin repeat domain-containing protein, partial [Planctomycetota bacterium]
MTKKPTVTSVLKAASQGNVTMLRSALKQGFDPNELGGRGEIAPIHAAAAANNNASLKLLLARGANLNLESGTGVVPVAMATKSATIRWLCNNGANPNHLNALGIPPIAYQFDPGAVKALIAQGASVDQRWDGQIGAISCSYRDFTKLAQIVSFSIPTTVPGRFEQCNSTKEGIELLKVLLRSGADPNVQFQLQRGPPLLESYRPLDLVDDHEAIDLLLSHEADPALIEGGLRKISGCLLHSLSKAAKTIKKYRLHDKRSDALLTAIVKSDIKKARTLIDDGVDVDAFGRKKLPKQVT